MLMFTHFNLLYLLVFDHFYFVDGLVLLWEIERLAKRFPSRERLLLLLIFLSSPLLLVGNIIEPLAWKLKIMETRN